MSSSTECAIFCVVFQRRMHDLQGDRNRWCQENCVAHPWRDVPFIRHDSLLRDQDGAPFGGQLGASTPNCLAYEAGAEALPPMGGDMAGTCDEV